MNETLTMTPPETGSSLIRAAERLIPLLREQADAGEDARRLTPTVYRALLDEGLYRITMPPEAGGRPASSLSELMRILQTLAHGDASAAWVVFSTLGLPVLSAFMPEGGPEQLFSPGDTYAAGTTAGMGRAVAVEGGYRVTGRWPFASGIHQATVAGATCFILDGDAPRLMPDGSPAVVVPAWRVEDCTIEEVWDTTGLRATGSDTIAVEDLFVPAAHVADFSKPPRPGFAPMHYIDIDNGANVCVAAIAIGIAEAAIEAFQQIGPEKRLVNGDLLSESALGKVALASADGAITRADGHLYETVETMWEEHLDGAFDPKAWHPRTSMASVGAADAAIEAVSSLYRAAGTSAIFRTRAFDRCLRDVYTLGAHKTVQHVNFVVHGGAGFGQGE